MGESSGPTPSRRDREGVVAAMQNLPGETALGHVERASVDGPVDFPAAPSGWS